MTATACESSGAGPGTGGGGGRANTSLAGVGACLQGAGFGVTVVPGSELGPAGAENRGPGQTGELLVARQGVKPTIGADNADAVVAFWKSSRAARESPNAKATEPGMHAESLGSITVQPTAHLLEYVFRAARSGAGRRALYTGQVKKIERCVG